MVKRIKPTLANLEREEKAIANCFEAGEKTATTLREHVYNIKANQLFLAVDCSSFKEYGELGRIVWGGEKVTLSYRRLNELACQGEVEDNITKGEVSLFSAHALDALSRLRVEIKDDVTGEVIKKTHDLNHKKIKSIANKLVGRKAKAIGKNGSSNKQITAKMVREEIERTYGPKPTKTIAETINAETKRATKWLRSFEEALELNEHIFDDAEDESAGCAKRLATAYSKLASFLRKV